MREAKETEDKQKYSLRMVILRMVILRMVILRMVILRKDESEEDEPAHGYPAHGNPGWIPDNDFGLEVAIAVRPLPLSVVLLAVSSSCAPPAVSFPPMGRLCMYSSSCGASVAWNFKCRSSTRTSVQRKY